MIVDNTSLTVYEPVLRSLAARFTQNKQEVEDLVQETYYRALLNKEKFAEGTNLKAWLCTILRNIFINNYHRNAHMRIVNAEPAEPVIVNRAATDRNNSFRAFLSEDINEAIRNTGADFIRPFLMHYNGFRYDEIATTLSIPLGTVKSRIFSARKELQHQLRKLGIENSQVN